MLAQGVAIDRGKWLSRTKSFGEMLAALRQLRAEGIETITFQTVLCSTTLSVDELLAMGGEDAEAVLTHRLTDSSLTVG